MEGINVHQSRPVCWDGDTKITYHTLRSDQHIHTRTQASTPQKGTPCHLYPIPFFVVSMLFRARFQTWL